MYELALLVLVAATLLKKASRPFAFVLAAIWLLDAVAARTNHHTLIVWIDSFGVYPLIYLTWRNAKWWSVACAALSLIALPIHLWFWTSWSLGIDVRETYATIQCSVFLLSVAVLALGNYDIAEYARGILERARGVRDAVPHFARRGCRDGGAEHQEAVSLDDRIRTRDSGLGNRLSGRYRGWRVYDEAKAP